MALAAQCCEVGEALVTDIFVRFVMIFQGDIFIATPLTSVIH